MTRIHVMNPANWLQSLRATRSLLVAALVAAALLLSPLSAAHAQDSPGGTDGTDSTDGTGTAGADNTGAADDPGSAGTGGTIVDGETPPMNGDLADTAAPADESAALGGVKKERDNTKLNERMWRPAMVGMGGQFNYIFGAPHLNGIDTTPKDHFSFSTRVDFATTNADKSYSVSSTGDEKFLMDGAVVKLVPELMYGLADSFDIGLRIGLAARGGSSFIVNQSDTLLASDGGEAGISDITVVARWRIYTGDERNIFRGLIAVAEIKIPSQMTNGLISSGAIDLTGMFTAAFQVLPEMRVHAGIGFTFIGPGWFGMHNQYFLNKRRDLGNVWLIGASMHWDLSSLFNIDMGETTHLVGSVEYHAYGAALLYGAGTVNATMHDAVLTLGMQLGDFGITGAAGVTLGGSGNPDFIASLSFTYFQF